jgi:hypothetical protein
MNDRLNARPVTIDPKMKAGRRIWNTVAINNVQIIINANEIRGTSLIEANSERESQEMSCVLRTAGDLTGETT